MTNIIEAAADMIPSKKGVKAGVHSATDSVIDGIDTAASAVGSALSSVFHGAVGAVDEYGKDALAIGYGVCLGGLAGGPIGAVGGGLVAYGATRR